MIVCDRCQKFLIIHNQNKITLRENTGTNKEVVTSFEICDDCVQEAEHIPIVYEINQNECHLGVIKSYYEYYCPNCYQEIEYKQKQCECGNKIFWRFMASRLSDFIYKDIPGGTSDDNSPTNV